MKPFEVKFYPVDGGGFKVADVELWFNDGPMAGLKLMGFSIVSTREDGPDGGGLVVSVPARHFSTTAKRNQTWAMLRPQTDLAALDRFRDYIIAAWQARKEQASR